MNINKNLLVRITPLFLIGINFILKLPFISTNSIGGDEPFSIYYSQMDISSIIELLYNENNPPLHFFLLHYWIKYFGIGAFSVRLPSLIFSTCTVYFIYRIGKDFFSYTVGLTAGLLFTFSNYHLFFSHEARVYPLFAMLTGMSMFYFLKICTSEPTSKNYLYLFIINTLILYAHYFGALVVFIQVLCFLFLKQKSFLSKKNLIYLFSLTLFYSPNIYILWKRFSESISAGTWLKAPEGIESLYNMLWQFSNKPLTTVAAISILLITLFKLFIKRDIRNSSTSHWVILTWFLFPFIFMFVISYWVPMFLDRYLIFVSMAYYLLLAICADHLLKEHRLKLFVPLLIVLLFAVTFDPNVDNKRHVQETIAKVVALKNNKTKILVCPQDFVYNFTYYYSPDLFKNANRKDTYNKMLEDLKSKDVFVMNKMSDINLADADKIIYLDAGADFLHPDNNIIATLDENYVRMNAYRFHEIFTVYEYQNKINK